MRLISTRVDVGLEFFEVYESDGSYAVWKVLKLSLTINLGSVIAWTSSGDQPCAASIKKSP